MSDMVTRAAKAMSRAEYESIDWSDLESVDPEGATDCFMDTARAALLAALDPEDEALVASLQSTINDFCVGRIDDEAQQALAFEIVASLKRMAPAQSFKTAQMLQERDVRNDVLSRERVSHSRPQTCEGPADDEV